MSDSLNRWTPVIVAVMAIVPNVLVYLQGLQTEERLAKELGAKVDALAAEAEKAKFGARKEGLSFQELSSRRIPRTLLDLPESIGGTTEGSQCLIKGPLTVQNIGLVPVRVQTVTFDVVGVNTNEFPSDKGKVMDVSYNNLLSSKSSYVEFRDSFSLSDPEIVLHPSATATYAWAFALPREGLQGMLAGVRARAQACEVVCRAAAAGQECSEGFEVTKNCYDDFVTTSLQGYCD